MSYIIELAQKVKDAQKEIAMLGENDKNELLLAISHALLQNADKIIDANKKDLQSAKQNGISDTMIDRLMLNHDRIKAISDSVKKVIAFPDPIGEVIDGKALPNGLTIVKKRVPLGVIGIIYESRPNVTVDSAVLCLKSSNAAILRGGKEAINSNSALMEIMQEAIRSYGFNHNMIALIKDTSRETATEMMKLNGYIDVLIPRGGAGLIQAVIQNATVPVIETGVGNCHIYVDSYADLDKAVEIVYNAKTSRPSVCNACESLLVHSAAANKFLPMVKTRLDEKNVALVGCDRTIKLLGDCVQAATDIDYASEFLDYKLSVKIVDNIDEAIQHIQKYTTHHSEAIVTDNINNANEFSNRVDAAVVYINSSTRFTDGEVFGMGAEIGISTQKLHVRGPMGVRELTSMKYIVTGNGNVR